MAIIQALLAAIVRSAGRIVNTAVGWATLMVFGRVPEKRQIYISIMTFGSVIWIAVVIGIAFPSAGTFLLSFVPLPKWVSRGWVRIAMLVAAAVLPAIVGGVSLLLKDPEDRPRGMGAVRMVLRGYLFTLGLAITIVMMAVLAPIMKLQTLSRRWTTQHVPVVVEADDYEDVLEQVQHALAEAGWRTERQPASWMVRLPTRVLTLLAGGALENLVARQLTTLRADSLEAVLHPSDLVLSGKPADVVHARAMLAEALAFGKAHLTWTKEGQALEDRMRRLHRDVETGSAATAHVDESIRAVERELKRVELTYDEWEVLFRQKLLLELAASSAGMPVAAMAGQNGHVERGWARPLLTLGMIAVHDLLGRPRVAAAVEALLLRAVRQALPPAPPRRAELPLPAAHGDRPARSSGVATQRSV